MYWAYQQEGPLGDRKVMDLNHTMRKLPDQFSNIDNASSDTSNQMNNYKH